MKLKLLVLVIVLFPQLSFAQNGGVSFGAIEKIQDSAANGAGHTTNTSSTSTSMGMGFDNGDNQPPPPSDCKKPMAAGSFNSAKETVIKAGFEDTKLVAAKNILTVNCISTEQVVQICKLFGFEQTRLDFAKLAYSKTTDRANYSKVSKALTYPASRASLDDFIRKGGR